MSSYVSCSPDDPSFALALQRTSLGKLPAWSIAVGFGAATEILWELS